MLGKFRAYFRRQMMLGRVSMALSRAAATHPLRVIDPTRPASWEFTAFSQNGEDGVLDYLTRRIKHPNRYTVEIGASHGLENNTSWLAIGRRYTSLMVEAEARAFEHLRFLFHESLNINVDCVNQLVTIGNVVSLYDRMLFKDPDVFSIDIDGNDYHILNALFELGLRPSIVVVEYNSAFGPHESVTIEYQEQLDFLRPEDARLYYGVSIAGWRAFFTRYRYAFLGVESNGVNAVFVNPAAFDRSFISKIRPVTFQENLEQMRKHGGPWTVQNEKMQKAPLIPISRKRPLT